MAENSLQMNANEHIEQHIPHTSPENIGDDSIDTQSGASSASALQMSVLENRLENEMTKMASMVKNTVSTLQNTISATVEQFERKFAEIEQKLNSLATDRGIFANRNENRNTSVFGRLSQSNSKSCDIDSLPSQENLPSQASILPSHTTQSNQNGISTSIDLTRAQESICKGGNSSGNNAPISQSCPNYNMERPTEENLQSKGSNHLLKMKPQNFDGKSDFDEFLCQFDITCEINAWKYKEKSLYLANCLSGEARSLLNELDPDGRRDYDTLIGKLRNRFGSVNRSEIYRTQLKSRTRNKGETIQELSQAIKKLVRQAYPNVNKDVIETLSLDNFIDAITDSDIRMRVRELSPKSLEEAEQICVRLEAYKIADKQRSRLVGRLDTENEQGKVESRESTNQFEMLSEAISTLTDEVKNFTKINTRNTNKGSYKNQGSQRNNQNYDQNRRLNRSYQNNHNRSGVNCSQNYGSQYRGDNYNQTNQNRNRNFQNRNHNFHQDQPRQNRYNSQNQEFPPSNRNNSNTVNMKDAQENLNQSDWGATTRQH